MPEVFTAKVWALEKNNVSLFVVRASLNGSRPFRLLVDTGTSTTCLSHNVAVEELGLTGGRPERISGIGAALLRSTGYVLDSIEVLGEDGSLLRAESLKVVTTFMNYQQEEECSGYLGMNWLGLYPQVCFHFDPPGLDVYLER